MWEYKAYGNYEDSVVGNIKTNKFGFRDEDYRSPEKPDDIYRVAFVGDSVTLGYAVDYDDIFVRMFEAYAKKRKVTPRIQALNFGVDGYNTLQIYELLRTKVIRFSPDNVVYIMHPNDFDIEYASSGKSIYFRKPKSILLQKIGLLKWCLSKKDYYMYSFDKNKKVVFKKIIEMRAMLNHRGVDFQVAIVPVFDLNQNDFKNYSLIRMHEEIVRILGANKIDFVDLLMHFKVLGQPPRFYANDIWHPNIKGQQIIAQYLIQKVLSETKNGSVF